MLPQLQQLPRNTLDAFEINKKRSHGLSQRISATTQSFGIFSAPGASHPCAWSFPASQTDRRNRERQQSSLPCCLSEESVHMHLLSAPQQIFSQLTFIMLSFSPTSGRSLPAL